MKITPIPTGGTTHGQVTGNNVGASPEKLAAAKAILEGKEPIRVVKSDVPVEHNTTHAERKTIKMKTQVTPGLSEQVSDESTNIQPDVEVKAAEDTKPLDPQRVALQKQRRALQLKEREIADREKALANAPKGADTIARLKSDPLSVLQEAGVTYDQLTEAIINSNGSNLEIQKLKSEIQALKEGVDKTFQDRDTKAEQDALAVMRQEAVQMAKADDTYELVRETDSVPEVIDLIHRQYKKTGEILDVSEAMNLVENYLFDEASKIASLKKVQSKFVQAAPQPLPNKQPVRTLTNRDTSRVPLSRRDRALLAFSGQLKK